MEAEGAARTRLAAVLEDAQDSLTVCCFDMFEGRNKVVPSVLQSDSAQDFDFVEISPQRRIRVIHLKPFQRFGVTNTEEQTEECDGEVDEEEEEEYWFENAAPKRLPVIQPQPQPQQNRIINKFEPRKPSVGSPGTTFISPGRLPRKTLVTKLMETETDDFEDGEAGDSGGEESPPARSPASLPGFEHMAEILLEMSPDSDTDTARPRPRRPGGGQRPTSPGSASSSRSVSPDLAPAADDSLHPSPELPHRAVSSRPAADAVDGEAADTAVVISGGNLGGVANKGFADDEVDTGGEAEPEAAPSSPSNCDQASEATADSGNPRVRDPASTPATSDPLASTVTSTEAGESSGVSSPQPPILFFIHGVGGAADSWNSQLAFFVSQGYEVVAPDLLGHGFSSCPDTAKAYTFPKLLKDVLTIFDTYVPEHRKSVIFGHSYGCSLTTALTRARLERVVTLVLIASGGPTPLAPAPRVSKYPKCVKSLVRRVFECKVKGGGGGQQKYSPRGKTIKYRAECYDLPAYVLRHVAAGALWPEGDAALHRRVTVPTLLVYGMRDTLVSLVEECEMERTLPRSVQSSSRNQIFLHHAIKLCITQSNIFALRIKYFFVSSRDKNIYEKYLQGVSGVDPERGTRRDDGHAAAAQHYGREIHQKVERGSQAE